MKKIEQLDFESTKKMLNKFSLPYIKTEIINDSKEISKICKKIGFPMVMKISSKEVVHKSDIGGVISNINNLKEAKVAYNKIIRNVKKKFPQADIEGVLVQNKMLG
ncbi:acetate--CoA ligase family protein, partial [Nanoarchaeota archaeon]